MPGRKLAQATVAGEWAGWLAIVALSVALPSACSSETPHSGDTPPRGFTAEQLVIEDVRGSAVTWSGTAARAEGDAHRVSVTDVHLKRPAGAGDVPALTLDAVSGDVALDGGDATLNDVRVLDERGRALRAPWARYAEHESRVVVGGPLVVDGPGIHATASSAVVSLSEDKVDLEGPVVGRWDPTLARATP